jgi:Tfp pilus assembly protein PilF
MRRPLGFLIVPAMMLMLGGCAEKAMHIDAAKRLEATDAAGAVEECKKVLKDKPTDFEANMVLARCLQKLNDNAGAEEAYKNALKGDSKSVDAHIKLGTLFLNRKNTDEAKQEFEQATFYDSKSVPALCGQGQVFEAKGDMGAAVGKYRDAIKADPDNIDAHQTLAQALGKMDKFDEAKVEIEAVRKLKEAPPKPKS